MTGSWAGPWREQALGDGTVVRLRRLARTVPVADLAVDDAVARACAACPSYGRQFSCPPHSPDLVEHLAGATHARVVCLELTLEHLPAADSAERQRLGFFQGQQLLAEELLAARAQGHAVAGCGPCPSCSTCSAAAGEAACRTPERCIYSLESLGVDVAALLRHCFAIDLEWGGPDRPVDLVRAVGAVFTAV